MSSLASKQKALSVTKDTLSHPTNVPGQVLDNKDCEGSPYLTNIYLEDLNFSSLEHVVLYIVRVCCQAVVQAPSGNVCKLVPQID